LKEFSTSFNIKEYEEKIHEIIIEVTKDETFQKMFKVREEYHIFDGSEYFFNKLDGKIKTKKEIIPPYKHTFKDILHIRKKTTGINNINFIYENRKYEMIDVH
jgi:hypothetical protein